MLKIELLLKPILIYLLKKVHLNKFKRKEIERFFFTALPTIDFSLFITDNPN